MRFRIKYEQWVLSKCSPVDNKVRSGHWTIREDLLDPIREDLLMVQILIKGE